MIDPVASPWKEAWEKLSLRLGERTSWGRNQLRALMSECMEEALRELHDRNLRAWNLP